MNILKNASYIIYKTQTIMVRKGRGCCANLSKNKEGRQDDKQKRRLTEKTKKPSKRKMMKNNTESICKDPNIIHSQKINKHKKLFN